MLGSCWLCLDELLDGGYGGVIVACIGWLWWYAVVERIAFGRGLFLVCELSFEV